MSDGKIKSASDEKWPDRVLVCSSEKVGLCILSRDDVPTIWKTISDPDVNRFLNARWRLHYLENEYKWYESLTSRSESERAFGILVPGDTNVAGVIYLIDLDFKNRSSLIGCIVGKKHWRKGIASEATELIKKYAFEEMNLRKLYALVFEPNVASIRVLEKTGFRNVGKYHSHVFVPGKGFVDELMFEAFNQREVKR